MHRPIFGHSFAVLVAPILLSVLAFNFLNKKKASVRRNAKDADTGAPGSMTVLIENNADESSSLPTGTDKGASSPSSTETNSGASSSTTGSTGNCCEVFLSFRGPDTRHGFTDHLYHGLLRVGINAFRDDDELCQGEDIRPKLMAAITNSKILVPIFSENYGTSSWCLDELVEIMERKNNNGQIVLPIFYKVKPSDVGHQIGSFGKLFHEREGRLLERSSQDRTNLEKWKKALREVSTVKGYEAHGSEVELVNLIVQRVLRELKKNFELVISKNLVGIESHVEKVMELIDDKFHAPLFVGIHGMGGIGKTTLAKAIYNKLSNQFEHRSFISDIRESWKSGIHQLQKKLISDILQQEIEIRDESEGTNILSSRLKGEMVLVVLDDVDNVDQVKRLVGNHDWFSSRSRIIITTRNERILKDAKVDYEYDLKEMDYNQSLILFSKHAFLKDSPPKDFEGLTREVVTITGGLPLCLEVFGSLFCGKASTEWRDKIKKLQKIPNTEVQKRLQISYEALEYEQKQIFLDIACFFIGIDKRITSYMWEACEFFPGDNIEKLRFMSLIKIENDHELRMHDQLRDLGRAIVREKYEQRPWCRSRLWDSNEALKVLKTNKGTDEIVAIDMSTGRLDGDIYTNEQFKNLTSLRFLHMMKGAHLKGDFEHSIEELKWLQWENCPMNFEAKNFHPRELVVLQLQSGATNERWQGWSYFKMAENLKFLDLSYCHSLENTDFLSAFKKLEVLILNFCEKLRQIDSSIGDLKDLLRLELYGCMSLTELPAEIGNLKALEQLFVRYTNALSALPDSIGSLENLKILDISCNGIKKLPNDIGRLRQLQHLEASCCKNMDEMPESIGSLENLEILDISRSGIREFPNSIGGLRRLRELNASYCKNLKGKIPESIGSLENLEILDISCSGTRELPNSMGGLRRLRELNASYCENLKGKMPESICNLSSLQCFDVHGCKELQSLPNLPSSLTELNVTCQSRILPSLSHLTHLKELDVYDCRFLKCIPEFCPQSLNTPFKLEILKVHHCESIEILDVSQLIHLRELSTSSCENLREVLGLDRLKYLEELTITFCNSQLDLPQFGGLKQLDVCGCKNLVEIQGLDRLVFLEKLSISKCASIERLLLPKSRTLKLLGVSHCESLIEIQGLDRLEFLENLYLANCASIRNLPILCWFDTLRMLTIDCCDKLRDIQSPERFPSCEGLWIRDCKSLAELPNLSSFHNLRKLFLSNFHELREIPGLEESISLKFIAISRCSSIEILPDLSSFTRLISLIVQDCEQLTELRGLEELEQLVELDISGCKSLKTIPKLSRTRLYQNYENDPSETFQRFDILHFDSNQSRY